MSKTRHVVAIEFPSGDQEAQYFSIQLSKAFQDAKWQIAFRSVPAPPMLFGLDVPGPENEATADIRRVLVAVGLTPQMSNMPIPGMFMGTDEGNKLTPDCRLVVGAKLTAEVLKTIRH